MTRWFAYIFLIAVGFLLSCGHSRSSDLLRNAERSFQDRSLGNESFNLDSVAWILEERIILSELPDSDRALYGQLLTFAHLLQERSLVNDSLINYSLDYYKRINRDDPASSHLSFTYWLKSVYLSYQPDGGLDRTALLREAIDSSFARSDSSFLPDLYYALMDVNFNEGRYRQSVDAAKEWLSLPQKGRNIPSMFMYMMGLSYAHLAMEDSADYYLSLAADSAYFSGYRDAFHYARNYADYLAASDPWKSISYLRLMEKRFPDNKLPRSYIVNWLNIGQLDSARYYLAEDERFIDQYGANITGKAFHILYKMLIDAKENKHIQVVPFGQYCDSIFFETEKQARIEKERIVAQNRLEQKNLRLEIDRQRAFIVLLLVLFAFLLIAGGAILYIRDRRARLIEMEERLEVLRQLLEEAKRTTVAAEEEKPDSAFFRKVLLQQLGIIRLMATVPTQQNKELLQQMSRITNEDIPVDTLLVWEDLYPVIDAVYDNFYTRLIRLSAGRLLEKEIQLCCLLCAGFSTKEISVVTQQSVRTIYQRKTDIRHKLDMDEKEDIVAFINT